MLKELSLNVLYLNFDFTFFFPFRLIDCKHFESGNGNCPFGASCFYKVHLSYVSCFLLHFSWSSLIMVVDYYK